MRADENITEAEEKASKAFNQEFPDENSAFAPLNLLQKAEAAVPERERLDEDDQSRTESPGGEHRDAWLGRWDRQKPLWTAFRPEDWDAITAHVHAADFPETTSRWHSLGREPGFGKVREVFVSPTDLFRMYCFAA